MDRKTTETDSRKVATVGKRTEAEIRELFKLGRLRGKALDVARALEARRRSQAATEAAWARLRQCTREHLVAPRFEPEPL